MQPRWLTVLLVLLQEAWSARRDAHIRFLKLQVEMLQSRLRGNRVIPDPVERRRLMKLGAEMGHAVEHTLGIVSIKTYRRWLREERGGPDQSRTDSMQALARWVAQTLLPSSRVIHHARRTNIQNGRWR